MRVCWYVSARAPMVQSYTYSDHLTITHTHTHTHTHTQGTCTHKDRSVGFAWQLYLFQYTTTLKEGRLNNMGCLVLKLKIDST